MFDSTLVAPAALAGVTNMGAVFGSFDALNSYVKTKPTRGLSQNVTIPGGVVTNTLNLDMTTIFTSSTYLATGNYHIECQQGGSNLIFVISSNCAYLASSGFLAASPSIYAINQFAQNATHTTGPTFNTSKFQICYDTSTWSE